MILFFIAVRKHFCVCHVKKRDTKKLFSANANLASKNDTFLVQKSTSKMRHYFDHKNDAVFWSNFEASFYQWIFIFLCKFWPYEWAKICPSVDNFFLFRHHYPIYIYARGWHFVWFDFFVFFKKWQKVRTFGFCFIF